MWWLQFSIQSCSHRRGVGGAFATAHFHQFSHDNKFLLDQVNGRVGQSEPMRKTAQRPVGFANAQRRRTGIERAPAHQMWIALPPTSHPAGRFGTLASNILGWHSRRRCVR